MVKRLTAMLVLLTGPVGSAASSGFFQTGSVALSAACAGKLPPDIRAFLERSFPSWQTVDLSNLSDRHRLLWEEKRPGECPGVTVGRFLESPEQAYAVLLYRPPDRPLGEKLLVLQKRQGKVTTLLLGEWKLESTEHHSVTWRLEPGRYESADGSGELRTRHDAVVLEVIEEGAKMYYVNGSRIRTLTIAE